MKFYSLMLSVLAAGNIFAAAIDADGNFNNFERSWSLQTKRFGTVELVRMKGRNFVQLASENNKTGQVGIYTARGIAADKGSKVSVSVDIKGGPAAISLVEYGGKKVVATQVKKIKKTDVQQTHKVNFTVKNSKTTQIRISFKVIRGAVAVISNVKVDMHGSGENSK